jgi:DNA-directed RNA polymerase specialized sigma24 family protein
MATIEELRSLTEINDPKTRALQIGKALADLAELIKILSDARRGAIHDMRDAGDLTYAQIAGELGLTPARISQLLYNHRQNGEG